MSVMTDKDVQHIHCIDVVRLQHSSIEPLKNSYVFQKTSIFSYVKRALIHVYIFVKLKYIPPILGHASTVH